MSGNPRPRSRGFTLIELLVVIGIIAGLTGIGLTAMGRARETARSATCRNKLRDLAQGAIHYSTSFGAYPPGVDQKLYKGAPVYRGTTLYVHLLPYLDQSALARQWDYTDPLNNTLGDQGSRTAMNLAQLACPSDVSMMPRAADGRWWYGLTSYGGNGGTRSYFPSEALNDGIFSTTGSASEPQPNQKPVRVEQVRDPLQRTVLFGERNHGDADYEEFAAYNGVFSLAGWGQWACSGGRRAIGHVTLAAAAPLNYRHASAGPGANSDPSYYSDLRLTAYGSMHPGGANLAFAGGNVEFTNDGISFVVFQSLCTRAGEDRAPSAASTATK